MDTIFAQFPLYQTIILLTLTCATICQIIYWISYGAIAKYRNRHRLSQDEPLPAVSVIVIVNDNPHYIENGLPLLLEQEHPNFEVVVVNDCGGADIDFELTKLSRAYPFLRFTTIKKDNKFNHSRKIPLVIGIKAATHENIIITDTDALPSNEKWLAYMCRGMAGADLVIGYTGFEIEKGIANKIIRCSRLAMSIRYLSSAINGKPYRGIYNNIGYTKSIFFDSRGYTNLTMTVGEDDLFVQKIARRCNTSVIINPQSTMRQRTFGGLRWWWQERRYSSYAYRYYPAGIKIKTFTELLSRTLFFLAFLTMVTLSAMQIVTSPILWASAAALFIAREATLLIVIRRVARRLGEIKIVWSFMVYDLISPLMETILAISRRMSPPLRLWIQNSK